MLNRYQQPIDEIWSGPESLESDPVQIHKALTKQFDSHHKQNPRTVERHDWMAYKDHPELFLGAPEFEAVPEHLRKMFSKSLSKHNTNHNLQKAMKEALEAPITFQHFKNAVKTRPKYKSPGISGTTINMIQSLPEGPLHTLYDNLNFLWLNRNLPGGQVDPESWAHRWMCLVPKDKVGPVKLDRIRPISLYEVTRKLWTGILNDRITHIWETQRALHQSQYGYRPHVGTESEIIQLLNIIADASETNKSFFLMGFDT
jgi:hypothetical protein